LYGKPVIAFVDTALDKAFVKGFPSEGFPEEWVQNIKQVCPDHVEPESRYESLTNLKD